MLEKIRKYINENKMLDYGDGVVIGLSGGADSVCLLKVLCELKEEYGFKLYAAHINHGIRGQEAIRDRDFAEVLCKSLGVEFFDYYYDIPKLSETEGIGLEETGRKYRYIAFYETLKSVKANKIAVAHNKNDNAETMLMRLLRGTGLKGLGGIEPVRDNIIRPLLCVSRNEIEEYLGDMEYITDSSNLSPDYNRNKIRLSLLPYIEKEFNPSVTDGLFRTAELLRQENDYIEREALKTYEKALDVKYERLCILDIDQLLKLDEVILRRVLRLATIPLTPKKQDIEYKHIKDIQELLTSENGSEIDLIAGIKARKDRNRLCVGYFEEVPEYEYEIYPEKEVFIKEAGIWVLITDKKRETKEYGVLDPSCISFPLNVRTKRDGDRIAIKGGRQEIKKVYSEKRIGKNDRAKYPMLTDGEKILAVLGLKKAFGELEFRGEGGYFVYIGLAF